MCFEAVSGLKVTFHKSQVLGVRVDEPNISDFAGILGCMVGSFLATYLGLPLCRGNSPKSVWNTVVERIEKKLSTWKANYLSIGGRVTQILSALSNLPIYFLSLFKCPATIADCIERLQREFLWHGKDMSKKYHLVKWDNVCRSKNEGGLGIRPIRQMNCALLGKWLWRIGEDNDSS